MAATPGHSPTSAEAEVLAIFERSLVPEIEGHSSVVAVSAGEPG